MHVETTIKHEGQDITVSADFAAVGDGTYGGLVKAMGQEFAEGQALGAVSLWARQKLAAMVRAGLDDNTIAERAKVAQPGTRQRKTEAEKAQDALDKLTPEQRAAVLALYSGKQKAA